MSNTSGSVIDQLIAALDSAEISIAEASAFLPVSRATLFNWKGGHTSGDQLRLDLVAGYTRLIERAVNGKHLPLQTEFKKKERVAKIKQILAVVKNS